MIQGHVQVSSRATAVSIQEWYLTATVRAVEGPYFRYLIAISLPEGMTALGNLSENGWIIPAAQWVLTLSLLN
jgi:hypothetical protein